MEIPVTWLSVFRVRWALAWRGLVVLAAFSLAVVAVAFVVGAIYFFLCVPTATIQTVGTLMATAFLVLATLPVTVVPLPMILGKSFGDFRIVLFAASQCL